MIRAKYELSRTELYEKVWSIPMQKLAKQYGISDVGLTKLCRRHAIPLPIVRDLFVDFGDIPCPDDNTTPAPAPLNPAPAPAQPANQ